MEALPFHNGAYTTDPGKASRLARLLPSLAFYRRMTAIVFRSSSAAKRGRYRTPEWAESSRDIMEALERAGVVFEITGADHFISLKEPCVFIGNHMSTLETFVLPCIIAPFRDLTFVVKQSLIDYPVFKHVMRSRDPIVVGRTNPREDLKAVLEGGTERLKAGRSIVIFPQTTRTDRFDAAAFNTIGVKLAKKADAPVIPVALKTDAWGNGRLVKDFGPIDPAKRVRFSFGSPLRVADRGVEEHQQVVAFIEERLRSWGA